MSKMYTTACIGVPYTVSRYVRYLYCMVSVSLPISTVTHSRSYTPSSLAPVLRVKPDQTTRLRLLLPAACSCSAMCVTLSPADEEKRSTEIDNHTMDHQSDALVRNFFSISSQLKKVADIP